MVSQDIWDKTRRVIAELKIMEMEYSKGMHRASIESIRGSLVYVSITYRVMTPYSKGMYLTLDIWSLYRDKEG